MWVVLLDGVGGCASPRAGRAAFRGRAAEKGPYPVLGRRTDAGAAPKPPIRACEAGLKKAASPARIARLLSRFASRNRFVRPAALPGIPASSSPTGVEFYSVRAAKTSIFGQGSFLTYSNAGASAAPQRAPKTTRGASAAVLDPHGDEIQVWWKKSTTKSSKSPTTR